MRKIYVLDTSVILHDSDAISNFEENDIAIPIAVLEELDQFKQGNTNRNFEARAFIRFIDTLVGEHTLQDWIPMNGSDKGRFKVIMPAQKPKVNAEQVFDERKADHRILNAAMALQEQEVGSKVVLVTKDINLRLKAKALNLPAEDYETGKIKDVSNLYTGRQAFDDIPTALIDELFDKGMLAVDKLWESPPVNNQYFILSDGMKSVLAYYNPVRKTVDRVDKHVAYGIKPRNAEQTFVLHAIMNAQVQPPRHLLPAVVGVLAQLLGGDLPEDAAPPERRGAAGKLAVGAQDERGRARVDLSVVDVVGELVEEHVALLAAGRLRRHRDDA